MSTSLANSIFLFCFALIICGIIFLFQKRKRKNIPFNDFSMAVPDHILYYAVYYNNKSIIENVSQHVLDLFGYSKNEMVGKHIEKIFNIEHTELHKAFTESDTIIRNTLSKNGDTLFFKWKLIQNSNHLNFLIGENLTDLIYLKDEIEKAKLRLDTLLSNSGDLVFVLNKDLVINEFYNKNKEYSYVTKSYFIGRRVDQLHLPKPSEKAILEALHQSQTTRKSCHVDYSLELPGGTNWFEIKVTPLEDTEDDIKELLGVVRNVTFRKQVEMEKEQKQKKTTIFNNILLKLSLSQDYKNISHQAYINEITKLLSEGLEVNRISIWKYEVEKISLECLYEKEENFYTYKAELFQKDYPAYFNAIKNGEVIMASDAANHNLTYEFKNNYLNVLNIKSMLDLPIIIGGDIYGVICCEQKNKLRNWTEEEATFVRMVADIYSVFLESKKRIEAESLLTKTKELLDQSNKTAKLGAWEYNFKINQIQWSDVSLQIFGLNLKEIILDPIGIMYINNINTKNKIVALYENLIENGIAFDEEININTASGDNKWLRLIAAAEVADGKCVRAYGSFQDITEQVSARLALAESEYYFKQITETIDDVFWLWNIEEDRMEFINPNCEKLFGYTQNDYYNDNLLFYKFVIADDLPIVFNAHEFIKQDKFYEIEYRVLTKEGQHKWIYEKSFAIENEKGNVIKSSGLCVDITKRKEIDLERRRNKEMEFVNKTKSEFIANMSHEIRTPLNSVIGLSDLLKQTTLSPQQNEYISIINYSANLLLEIINNILDLSKIEAGKIDLKKAPVNIYDLCKEVENIFKYTASQKGVAFSFEFDESIHKIIEIDSLSFKQIIINIIGNAVKFTDAGKVDFKVIKCKETEEIQTLRFEVRDTGIGISEDKYKKIFEPFSQEDVSLTKKYAGTGLGLTISKKLLELMNSDLHVTSKLGEGSVFYFDIDVEISNQLEMINIEERIKKYETKLGLVKTQTPKKALNKILIVEDNVLNQFLLKTILEAILPLTELKVANNGKEAIQDFENFNPDVIFMDIQMPVMNGYEATKEIRKLVQGQEVPIIAVSAGVQQEDKEKCIEVGMNDFLSKPIIKKDIYNILNHFFYIHEIVKVDSKLEINANTDERIDLQKLEQSIQENGVYLNTIFPYIKESLQESKEELLHYFEQKDLKAINNTAHKLKGTALTVCCNVLSKLTYELECENEFDEKSIHEKIKHIQAEIDYVLTKF